MENITLEKINFVNGSAGKTPLNSNNMNAIQQNIENAINEVVPIITGIEENTENNNSDIAEAKINIANNINNILEINKFIENSMKTMKEEGTSIHVADSADYPCKLEIEGKSEQNGEPSPQNKVDIQNTSGDVEIKVVGKNLWNQPKDLDLRDVMVGHSNPYIVSPILTVYQYSTSNTLGAYFKNNSIILDTQKGSMVRGKITGLKPNTTYTISYFLKTNATKTIYRTLCANATVLTTKFNTKVAYSFTANDIGEFGGYSENNSNIIWLNQDERPEIEYQDIMLVEGSYTAETMPEFEEYKEQTVTFPFAEGQKLYKDGYLASDGIHNKRTQVVLTGSEELSAHSQYNTANYNCYRYVLPKAYKKATNQYTLVNALCSHLGIKDWFSFYNQKIDEEGFTFTIDNNNTLYIKIDKTIAPTLNDLKSYLSAQNTVGTPVVIEYELAEEETTPYTEGQATAYEQLQKLKTYRTVTNISNNQNTNMRLTYKKDLQTQFQEIETMLLESGV